MAHFQRAMMIEIDQAAQAMRDEEGGDRLEGSNQPTYAASGQWAAGRYLVIPGWVVRGWPA